MDFTAPSFSLGIDFEDPPPLAAGSDRREQARGYAAPDAPSFSLGIDFYGDGCGDNEPHLPAGRRREEQPRRYEAPDAPSFSLGIDDDDDFVSGGRSHQQAPPQVAPVAPSSLGIDDEDHDFFLSGGQRPERARGETLDPDPLPPPPETTRFKRLRRGPAPPPLAPTPAPRAPAPVATEASPMVSGKATLGAVGSLEDEIEDFTDEERPARGVDPRVKLELKLQKLRAEPYQTGPSSSSSRVGVGVGVAARFESNLEMEMALLFFDLSLLPSSSTSTSSSSSSHLLAAARALELGYAAVALDHPHRGLLADSHRCSRTALSSLPLPSSASLHRLRHGSPASHPFRQYTRLTLSLDSAAAAASTLAPSAARLLRTYDIVAARPLTQAAFDHLCQVQPTTELDIISIDFSHKLPFRLKLPMVRLALQRGLHFEIAYSPLINGVNSRRQVLAEAKLLVDWTKGKNIIISSAAHTANEIRGPYDVINLCAYLLGLSTHRAKAAISLNCRSLISKALRKKHFYKETIRIDRLLPNKHLNSMELSLGDWIGWDPISCEGDLQSLETNLEPSANKDELPGSTINSIIKVLHEKPYNADVSLFAEQPEQSTDEKEIPAKMEEGTIQVNRGEVLMNCGLSTLPTSLGHQNVARDTILDKPGNNEVAMAHYVQAGAASSLDLKSIDEQAEFVQDAMAIDATESCKLNLIAAGSGHSAHLSSDVKLACSALPQSMELSDTSFEHKGPDQSSDILDYAKAYTKHDTVCTSGEREDQAPLDHAIPFCSDVCLEDKGLDQSNDISVDAEAYIDTTEPLECPLGGRDDEAPLDLAVHLSSDLCRDLILPQQVMEEKIEHNMDESIKQTMRDKVEPIDSKRRTIISMEQTLHGQETTSASFVHDKGSSSTTWENDELKKQKSNETNAALEEDIAKIHGQLLNCSCASGKVEISTIRSEKRRRKLRSQCPAYLPFLGFLKSVPFKKKVFKVRGPIKSF